MTESLFPIDTESSQLVTNQATARKGLKILSNHPKFARRLRTSFSNDFRNKLAAAFALDGKIVYGRAFDAIGYDGTVEIEGLSVEDLHKLLGHITIYEVKSTSRNLKNFSNFFFSISTAEVLVAQSLKDKFKFLFVNTKSGEIQELSLQEVYGRAESIYPSWSIRFKK